MPIAVYGVTERKILRRVRNLRLIMELYVCDLKFTTENIIGTGRVDRNGEATYPRIECHYGVYISSTKSG
jgi:hypothetical protein